jgi:hypothetical protein
MKSWVIELAILACVVALWLLWPERWPLPADVRVMQQRPPFHSGDLLYFLEHGDLYPHPGHVALIVQDRRFGQWYIWEMPNPLFHAPMLLKPLVRYLQKALKKRRALVFLQTLRGAEHLDLLPLVRQNSATAQYDLHRSLLYWNRLSHDLLGMSPLPFRTRPLQPHLQHCTDAALMPLIQRGILRREIREVDAVLCPTQLLDPQFDINAFTNAPFRFEKIVRLPPELFPEEPPVAEEPLVAEPLVAEPLVAEPLVAEPLVAESLVAESLVAEEPGQRDD